MSIRFQKSVNWIFILNCRIRQPCQVPNLKAFQWCFDLYHIHVYTSHEVPFKRLFSFSVSSQLNDNTPPTIWLDNRDWILYENETVGSRVAQAHGTDAEGSPLQYGLEQIFYSQDTIPFRINPNTGTVYLNESLQGMVSWWKRYLNE